jgi:putative membrane protein (TIGR04086 family)
MLICKFNISLASPFSSVSLAVGSILGGYVSARKNGSKALLCGLVTAGIIIFILAAVGLIISQNVTLMSLIHLTVTLLGALIGSILGVSKTDKIKVV